MLEDRELEQLARKLGEPAADRVDPSELTAAVLARLRAEPTASDGRSWWRRAVVVRLAAAAVLVILAGWLGARTLLPGDRRVAQLPPPAVLDELAVTELAAIADSLQADQPVYELVGVSLDDLSEQQLEVLLREMEG